MKIQLSDHFTYGRLIRFTIPSIAMMIFISIYGVVDGFFVSNYAGKTPFSAVNLIMPFLMIVATVGIMFGTGGTALVAKTLGEEKKKKQTSIFPFLFMLPLGWAWCFPCWACCSFAGGIPAWRRKGTAGKLCDLRKDYSGGVTFSCLAAFVPEFLYSGRKTPFRYGRDYFCRCDQYVS